MKKELTRWSLLALPLLLVAYFFALPVSAWAMTPVDPNYEIVIPKVDPAEKVHDLAGLFTPEQQEILREKSANYQQELSMDCVIVTTEDAKGLSSREYADDFYDYNGFGLSKGSTADDQRNGVLFLIDMDNRNFYISTTGMALRVYDDLTIEQILDTAFQYMPKGKYFEAMDSAVDAALIKALEEYQAAARTEAGQQEIHQLIDAGYDISQIDQQLKEAEGPIFRITSKILLLALIPAGILAGVTVATFYATHKRSISPAPGAIHYVSAQGIRPLHNVDNLVNSYTVRRKLPEPSSSSSGGSGSSGGFGGGGSSHSSSSGSSHGGGGRGF